ncbi:hypothetical protein [Pedosphaera parvula]|uniref:Uncharacterized protein n=1 Tax=Pedosphaera parvula (strain Ellin514) TaxID=320771 RepID=B9XE73_PEDPL|nr:hypothetical protein [Pedosphaera parvula]EEF61964.1 hypothetical protein Cflav_PD4627 [Pedosphaera parvula Ellin514]
MKTSSTPGAVKKFRRTPWRFQQTFQTPVQDLPLFVETIVSTLEPVQQGVVTIDQVVFDAKSLVVLLTQHKETATLTRDLSITAESKQEVEQLLAVAFGSWIDFIFIPSPKPFVIYADHDEFTTFYANTKSNLNLVSATLLAKGFKQIQDYRRDP